MDILSPDVGSETVIRTLLRAVGNLHSSAKPAHSKKIVVRNRALQFFPRRILQNLGIAIDYIP
ncbi:MAG: DUF6930 domain-containing protein [cyanobacterium endosymbiont of Rhopalodia sterrenbergii]